MPDTRSLILCATPRSGSTMIYDDLRAIFGLESHQEEPLLFYLFKHGTHPVFADAWDAVSRSHRISSFIFFKVMFQHVAPISTAISTGAPTPFKPELTFSPQACDAFFAFFSDAAWVHVKRRDILAQAVSVYFALTTRVWHKREDHAPDGVMYNETVPYDSDKMIQFAKLTYRESIQWEKFFSHYGVAPHEIYHEDAVSQYPDYWMRILRAENAEIYGRAGPRRVAKLGTKTNEIFRERLVEDLRDRIRANAEDAELLAAILSAAEAPGAQRRPNS